MFLKKLINNSKGSAQIVAVLAAALVSSVIMLSNAQMLTTFNKQNRKVMQTNVALDFRKQVEAFMTPENCMANMGAGSPGNSFFGQMQGNGANSIRTEPLRNLSGTAVFTPNSTNTYENGLLRFVGWRVRNTSTILRPTNPVKMIVDLQLHLEGSDGARVVRIVKLEAEKESGLNTPMASCYAVSAATSDMWTRDAGGNNIYNLNSGNVGMFTNDPTEKLDLDGSASFTGPVEQMSIENSRATRADANMIVAQNTGVGGAATANRLEVTGDSLVSGNYTSGGPLTTFNLSTLTTFDIGGTLSVTGASTLGAPLGAGPRLNVSGPVVFGSNLPDPEITPDFRLRGSGSFARPVTAVSPVNIGAPIGGADFTVNGGTSITGTLTTARYTAPSLCINGNCRTTFDTQTCAHGMWQINVNGTVQCAAMNCPAGELFKGLTATGQAICEDLPFNTCPSGQFIQSVNPATGAINCQDLDPLVQVGNCAGAGALSRNFVISISNGNATCSVASLAGGPRCPLGQVAIGFNADGVVTCSNPLPSTNCPAGQIVTGMNANGTPMCNIAFNPAACGAGQVARGLATDGSLVCVGANHLVGGSCSGQGVAVGVTASGSVICGCVPQVLTWTAGGNLCDASLPASAAGSYLAVDSVAPATGSATFTCTPSGWNTTGSSPTCTVPINGNCGSANGTTVSSAPSSNLCASGTATAVSGSGPWTWGCNGQYGGTSTANDACSAATTACNPGAPESVASMFDGGVGLCSNSQCVGGNYIAPAHGGTGMNANFGSCSGTGSPGQLCVERVEFNVGNDCNVSSRCSIITRVCGG